MPLFSSFQWIKPCKQTPDRFVFVYLSSEWCILFPLPLPAITQAESFSPGSHWASIYFPDGSQLSAVVSACKSITTSSSSGLESPSRRHPSIISRRPHSLFAPITLLLIPITPDTTNYASPVIFLLSYNDQIIPLTRKLPHNYYFLLLVRFPSFPSFNKNPLVLSHFPKPNKLTMSSDSA